MELSKLQKLLKQHIYSKKYRPILNKVNVIDSHIYATNLDAMLRIKNNYGLKNGLHSIELLGYDNPVDASDYPEINFNEKIKECLKVSVKELDIISRSASKDETRPQLMTIYFDTSHIVSCDGYTMQYKKHSGLNNSYLLNINDFKLITDFLKAEKIDQIEIKFNDDYAIIESDNFLIMSRLIKREYPSWKNIIPTKFKIKANYQMNYKFSDMKNLLNKFHQQVKMIHKDNKIYILPSESKVLNEIEIGTYSSNEKIIDYFINFKLLSDITKELKDYEIKYNQNVSPILINDCKIIMPMKEIKKENENV